MNLIHRDIKPENLMFATDGYLHITDFGIARFYRENNGSDTSGTPGYMAPEVMFRQNHTFNSDFFAIGVILYEVLMKKVGQVYSQRPYKGNNRNELRDSMSGENVKITQFDVTHEKIEFSQECINLTNALLVRDPKERIGFTEGVREIKRHPWFAKIDWRKLARKELESPFKPVVL